MNLQVGSIVIAKRITAICEVGEIGVCYEQYRLHGRDGWSFIFQGGGYDGFSPEEVKEILEPTGETYEELAGYQFQNVTQLFSDFKRGRFHAAFSRRP